MEGKNDNDFEDFDADQIDQFLDEQKQREANKVNEGGQEEEMKFDDGKF